MIFVRNLKWRWSHERNKNPCTRYIPGSNDCKRVAKGGHCAFQKGLECQGRVGGVGANLEDAITFSKKYPVANERAKSAVAKVTVPPSDERHVFAHL